MVTARLDNPLEEETTLTVFVEPVAPAVAGDFTMSSNKILTIAAGEITSTGMVSITAVNNDVDAANKMFIVQAVASGGSDVTDPEDVTLIIADDDGFTVTLLTVTLLLSPGTINESGSSNKTTVTAILDKPSSEATTLTVSVEPEGHAVERDFTMGNNNILTIAAGETTSTGTVTITAVDNTIYELDKMFTVKVASDDGLFKSAPVTLTIVDDEVSPDEQLKKANEQVLPSVLSKVVSGQVAAITGRLDAVSSGAVPSSMGSITMEGVATDVADYLTSHRESLHRGNFAWDWKQALSGRDFSLAGVNLAQREDSMMSDSQSSSLNFSLWGSFDYSSLADQIDDISLDGNILSTYFGVDTQLREGLTTGLALNISNSEFDLTENGAESKYNVSITTVNPYGSWSASEDLELWASFGYGHGQADLTDNATGEKTSESGDFTSFSAGGRFQFWRSDAGTGLALKLDGTSAQFLGSGVQRGRLAAEFYNGFSLGSGVLKAGAELGLLISNVHKSGVELVGNLSWITDTGFSAFGKGRVLLGDGKRKQWGLAGGLRYGANGGKEGLVLSIEPSVGVTDQLLSDTWSVGEYNMAVNTDAVLAAQIQAELSYGFRSAAGLFTPYTELVISEKGIYTAGLRYDGPRLLKSLAEISISEDGIVYRTGLGYELYTGLEVEITGSRKSSRTGDTENRVNLGLSSEF